MPVPLAGVLVGIQAVSALKALLDSGAQQRRAQQRRDSVINYLKQWNDKELADLQSANRYKLAAGVGGLNDALISHGRALGDANAGAGVYNSSATAGSNTLMGMEGDKALQDFATQSRFGEQQLLNSNQRYISGLELGVANQDLEYAQQQQANQFGSFGGLLKTLPGLFPGQSSQGFDPTTPGVLMNRTSGAYDIPNNELHTQLPSQPGVGGLGAPSVGNGTLPGGRVGSLLANPIQSAIQKKTQRNRTALGGLDTRTVGAYLNGMQGSKLPRIG